jgi:hypothetical protein
MESTIEEVEKFAAKVDRAAERVFASASIGNTETQLGGDDPKIIAQLLLIRTLSNFRGTVILLRTDRIVEARTIARCCFENWFTLAALSKDGQRLISEMHEDRKASQKARAECLMQQTREMAERGWEPKLRASIASLGKGQTKGKLLDPKQLAARGQLSQSYVYYADLTADAAHATLEALSRYQDHAQEGSETTWTVELNPPVDPAERRMTLMMVCEALLGVCVGVKVILELQRPIINGELGALMLEYQTLGSSDMLVWERPEGDQSGG